MALSGHMEIYGNRAPVTAGESSKTSDIVGFSDAPEEQPLAAYFDTFCSSF
jgi:hypothetical protein